MVTTKPAYQRAPELSLIVAIVEATPAGDRLRARLLLSETSQQIIPIVLAGVRCPQASKKGSDESNEQSGQAEEFGDEARWFVESKLLQRNVKVEIMYPPPQLLPLFYFGVNRQWTESGGNDVCGED